MCKKNVKVSVICFSYNQTDYIKNALNSFIMQKTTFPFEILIHDDASTDGTQKIIRSYQKYFPEIINPMFQIENQYSKGVDVSFFNYDRAQGKYIAVCEGDDYWIDPYKLQKQYEFMEAHPEYSMYCHNVQVKDESDAGKMKPFSFIVPKAPIKDRDIRLKEICNETGGYISTPSILFRTSAIKGFRKFSEGCPVGDFPLQLYMAMQGKIYYSHETMAVYRWKAKGSFTSKTYQQQDYEIAVNDKLISWLKKTREDYPELRKSLSYPITSFEIRQLRLQNRYTQALLKILTSITGFDYFCQQPLMDKLYIILRVMHLDPHKLALLFFKKKL